MSPRKNTTQGPSCDDRIENATQVHAVLVEKPDDVMEVVVAQLSAELAISTGRDLVVLCVPLCLVGENARPCGPHDTCQPFSSMGAVLAP